MRTTVILSQVPLQEILLRTSRQNPRFLCFAHFEALFYGRLICGRLVVRSMDTSFTCHMPSLVQSAIAAFRHSIEDNGANSESKQRYSSPYRSISTDD
jgi:hypothetical protein